MDNERDRAPIGHALWVGGINLAISECDRDSLNRADSEDDRDPFRFPTCRNSVIVAI